MARHFSKRIFKNQGKQEFIDNHNFITYMARKLGLDRFFYYADDTHQQKWRDDVKSPNNHHKKHK